MIDIFQRVIFVKCYTPFFFLGIFLQDTAAILKCPLCKPHHEISKAAKHCSVAETCFGNGRRTKRASEGIRPSHLQKDKKNIAE